MGQEGQGNLGEDIALGLALRRVSMGFVRGRVRVHFGRENYKEFTIAREKTI